MLEAWGPVHVLPKRSEGGKKTGKQLCDSSLQWQTISCFQFPSCWILQGVAYKPHAAEVLESKNVQIIDDSVEFDIKVTVWCYVVFVSKTGSSVTMQRK